MNNYYSLALRHARRFTVQLLGLQIFIISVFAQGLTPCSQTAFKQTPTFPLGSSPRSAAAEDFDGDGKSDIAVINNGVSLSVLRNTGTPGNVGFAPKVDFPMTGGVSVMAVGDMDGDGKKDVVAANLSNSNISLLRNTSAPGNLSFEPVVTFTAFISGSVSIADLDGDGKPDVFGLNNSNNVSVLINTSTGAGNINFNAPVSFTAGFSPKGVSAGDLDGDGKMDIVTSNSSGTISVLRNTSAATLSFAPKVDFPTQIFPGAGRLPVIIADLNGDNKLDVATGNGDGGNISVLRNTSAGAGSIGFAGQVSFSTGFGPNTMAAKDFDGDGKTDLVSANFYGSTLSVLRNSSTTGAINFEPRKEFGVGGGPTGIAAADFDGDGKPDIATANSKTNNISILQNKSVGSGSVSFNARQEFPVGAFGSNPFGLAVGDLDGDGKKDVITANNTTNNISVLRNTGTAAGVTRLSAPVDFPAAANSGPFGVALEDFDGDGKKDAVISNSTLGSVSVFRNISPMPGVINFAAPVQFAAGSTPRYVAAGDFDGDGKSDIAVGNADSGNVSVLRNAGSSPGAIEFDAHIDLAVNNNPSSLVIVDLDADGKRDIAVTNFFGGSVSILRNLSSGPGNVGFAPKADITINNSPYSVAAGDFDGDGRPDLAITNVISGINLGVSVLRNTSSGSISFAPKVDYPTPPGDFNSQLGHIASGDINNDGKPDLVNIDVNVGVSIQLNTSTAAGTISFAPRTSESISQAASAITVDDLDRDGKNDIVFSSYNTNNVGILQNPCTIVYRGVFDFDGDLKTDIGVWRASSGSWWYLHSSDLSGHGHSFGLPDDIITPGDYTGDGKADVAIWRPSTGEWFVRRSEDGSYFSYQFGLTGDIPAPADYDGDGITDTATFRPSTQTWYIFQSASGTFGIVTFGLDGDRPVPADYDGDGKADIAVWRPSNGTWWIVRSSNLEQRGYGFGLGTDKPVPGDYTGDGKADIAVWRDATREWFFLRSEDGSYYSYPSGLPGDIPAPGDYDGDGRFDSAVFRPSTQTWYIDGSTAGSMITTFGLNGDRPVPNAFVP